MSVHNSGAHEMTIMMSKKNTKSSLCLAGTFIVEKMHEESLCCLLCIISLECRSFFKCVFTKEASTA